MNASVNDAVTYLARVTRHAFVHKEPMLPSYRKLAAEAGVAPATMLKAIRFCCDQGVLSVTSRGIMVRSTPVPEYSRYLSGKGHRWKSIYERLRRDISHGRFAPGPVLPTPKELSHRYGASYRTLKKAIDALVDEKVIEPHGRTYRTRQSIARGLTHSPTVVVMLRGEPYTAPLVVSARTLAHLRSLETQCMRRGLRLKTCHWYPEGTRLRGVEQIRALEANRDGASNILGYFIWTTAVNPAVVTETVAAASRGGKPVAILDEEGNIDLSSINRRKRRIAHFLMAVGTLAGHQVARYLWELGHRRFAFIDFEQCSAFGSNRYAGMKEELDLLGKASVECYEIARGKVFPLKSMTYRTIRRRLFLNDPAFAPSRQPVCNRLIDNMLVQTYETIHRHTCRQHLYTQLPAIVAGNATAWIGCNDDIAIDCLDFLESRKINVPGDISVAGFDDGFEAMLRQLTSYNFNCDAYINAALDFILGAAPRGTDAVIEIEGSISARRTTAAIPEQSTPSGRA